MEVLDSSFPFHYSHLSLCLLRCPVGEIDMHSLKSYQATVLQGKNLQLKGHKYQR